MPFVFLLGGSVHGVEREPNGGSAAFTVFGSAPLSPLALESSAVYFFPSLQVKEHLLCTSFRPILAFSVLDVVEYPGISF